jgi:methyl-accepting chemotaxis protein
MSSNLRIGARLSLGFGIILALLVAVLVTDNIISSRNRNELFKGIETANLKLELTTKMKTTQLEGVVSIRSIGIYNDVKSMNREEAALKSYREAFNNARKSLQAMDVSEKAKKHFANIERLDKELEGPIGEARTYALSFNTEAVANVIATRTDPIYRQMLAELNALVDLQKAEERAMIAAAVASGQQLMWMNSLIGLVAVIIGIIFSQLITRSITQPLNDAVTIAKRVAAGDLTSVVQVKSRDETGELMQALKIMTESLMRIVGEVRQSTETIVNISRDIAAGDMDLSARTEAESSSLEETAAAMEQLTSTVQQNADNAEQANQLSASASIIAEKGGKVVHAVVETMDSINISSKKIVDIISVIDGIAFQTNILALNAAVEAARAGEQGRGFAVVATEVRNLAQRSAAAAKEINHLISDSVEKVGGGMKLVAEAGATMSEVVDSVKRVTDIMAEITMASKEQSSGIAEVNEAIAQMDKVTQQNARLVEEALKEVEMLQKQADGLEEVVSVFKLNDSVYVSPEHKPKAAPAKPAAKALTKPIGKPATQRAVKQVAASKGGKVEDGWEEF